MAVLAAGAPGPLLAQTAASASPRIALVIGEANYADQALATPVNDAALIAATLQAAGFDVVGARDLDGPSIRDAMRDFLAKAAAAGPDMQAFVYLAGRGVQYEGENFFVPVDAQIVRDSDTPMEAVRLSDFTHALAAEPGRARIIVLDAARANPYVSEGPPLAGGLALLEPDDGELIAFNAAPGSIANEDAGPYGVYARTLAGAIRQGGFPIEDALTQTRVQVDAQSGGALIPWSASKLAAPYYVFERADDAPAPPAVAALAAAPKMPIGGFPPDRAYAVALARDTLAGYGEFVAAFPEASEARRVRAILAARREALFWRRAVAKDTPEDYWTYLTRYPRGPHVADAGRRLAILAALAQPPADFAPLDYADLPPPPASEIADASRPVYVFAGAEFGFGAATAAGRFRLRSGRRLARAAAARAADRGGRVAGLDGGDPARRQCARLSRCRPGRWPRACRARRRRRRRRRSDRRRCPAASGRMRRRSRSPMRRRRRRPHPRRLASRAACRLAQTRRSKR